MSLYCRVHGLRCDIEPKIDGTERQVIKDVDSSSSSTVSTPRARIRACSISDPYVLILREDDTMGLFIGEVSKGKLRRKDMSMLGGKVSVNYSEQRNQTLMHVFFRHQNI